MGDKLFEMTGVTAHNKSGRQTAAESRAGFELGSGPSQWILSPLGTFALHRILLRSELWPREKVLIFKLFWPVQNLWNSPL